MGVWWLTAAAAVGFCFFVAQQSSLKSHEQAWRRHFLAERRRPVLTAPRARSTDDG